LRALEPMQTALHTSRFSILTFSHPFSTTPPSPLSRLHFFVLITPLGCHGSPLHSSHA
jgi:hypothetical protein